MKSPSRCLKTDKKAEESLFNFRHAIVGFSPLAGLRSLRNNYFLTTVSVSYLIYIPRVFYIVLNQSSEKKKSK